MDCIRLDYEQSQKESALVTRLAVFDAVILCHLGYVAVVIFRGDSTPVHLPGTEYSFSPIAVYVLLHALHLAVGFWAAASGCHATNRMLMYHDSAELESFREHGSILCSMHPTFAWWRFGTNVVPVALTAGITDNSLVPCVLSFLASISWMTLWANTVNFREPMVVPTNIWSYLKMPFQATFFLASIPFFVLGWLLMGFGGVIGVKWQAGTNSAHRSH